MTRKTTTTPARRPGRATSKAVLSLAALALLITGGLLYAGPLNPPAGPVASTYKTLAEVEPRIAINATNTPGDNDATPSLFKITQPGSYYLTGNITGVVGRHGIEIAASGVTLDLNGFDLVGVPAMGAFDGVSVTVGAPRNIAVVNGSVRNWGGDGVDLGTFGAINSRVEGVLASGNAGNGISTGAGSTVSNCAAYLNTGTGILTSDGCTVSNCSANNNSGNGIITTNNCTISDCSASGNTLIGIRTGDRCTLTNCTANQNGGIGISTGFGSTLTNCSASSNTSIGISTGFGCTVSNCSALGNTGIGISAGEGSTVSNCSAIFNDANGISTGAGSTVSNCSARSNSGSGISVGSGCTVADCTARANTLDGIQCANQCVIRGNTCSGNGSGAGDGAGIRATGTDNRIEGNNCTGADRGIDVDSAGNIIIKNTCSGNTTNWAIAIGNSVGPIVVAGTNAAVISGNGPVASTLGSTDPNANFLY